jgi:hypothetical protein
LGLDEGLASITCSIVAYLAVVMHRTTESAASLARQLDEHQQRLLALLAWAKPMLAKAQPPAAFVETLAERRMTLSRLLMDYALFKHRAIFEVAIAAGGERGRVGLRLKTACIAAGEEYRDFVRSARNLDLQTRWDWYRVGAAAVAETMKGHLAEERAAIRALLGVSGRNVARAPVVCG